jgi:hypothetical protein
MKNAIPQSMVTNMIAQPMKNKGQSTGNHWPKMAAAQDSDIPDQLIPMIRRFLLLSAVRMDTARLRERRLIVLYYASIGRGDHDLIERRCKIARGGVGV